MRKWKMVMRVAHFLNDCKRGRGCLRFLAGAGLASLAFFLSGCVFPYSPYPQQEVSLKEAPAATKELWSAPASSEARDEFTSVAFAADAQHVATGNRNGHIVLWKLGASVPENDLAVGAECIAALAVSPDGGAVISAGTRDSDPEHPGTEASGPMMIHRIDLASGMIVASATDEGYCPMIRFHPGGHFFAVTGAEGRFYLHNAQALATVFSAQHYVGGEYEFRTLTQPAFFLSASEDPMDVYAAGRHWQISGGGQAKLLNEYTDQADALGTALNEGYFTEGSHITDSFLHYQIFNRRNAGVVVAPLARTDVRSFLKIDGDLKFTQALFLPPTAGREGALALCSSKGIILADPARHTFAWLRHKDHTFQIAASEDGRRIAGCGEWGAAVWERSGH